MNVTKVQVHYMKIFKMEYNPNQHRSAKKEAHMNVKSSHFVHRVELGGAILDRKEEAKAGARTV
jgi:hypothetical protein